MQESHHHALTSRIEEVPVEPTLAPGYTMVGGPSCAPIRSAAPIQVAMFKPTGISYAKVTLPMQSTSGSSSKPAPFRMDKGHELLKKAGIQPTAQPLKTAFKALEEVDDNLEAMKEVLRKHKKFCDFASTTPIVQNMVASVTNFFLSDTR